MKKKVKLLLKANIFASEMPKMPGGGGQQSQGGASGEEGGRAEIGDTRTHEDGKDYKKVAEGKWEPVKEGEGKGKKEDDPKKKGKADAPADKPETGPGQYTIHVGGEHRNVPGKKVDVVDGEHTFGFKTKQGTIHIAHAETGKVVGSGSSLQEARDMAEAFMGSKKWSDHRDAHIKEHGESPGFTGASKNREAEGKVKEHEETIAKQKKIIADLQKQATGGKTKGQERSKHRKASEKEEADHGMVTRMPSGLDSTKGKPASKEDIAKAEKKITDLHAEMFGEGDYASAGDEPEWIKRGHHEEMNQGQLKEMVNRYVEANKMVQDELGGPFSSEGYMSAEHGAQESELEEKVLDLIDKGSKAGQKATKQAIDADIKGGSNSIMEGDSGDNDKFLEKQVKPPLTKSWRDTVSHLGLHPEIQSALDSVKAQQAQDLEGDFHEILAKSNADDFLDLVESDTLAKSDADGFYELVNEYTGGKVTRA